MNHFLITIFEKLTKKFDSTLKNRRDFKLKNPANDTAISDIAHFRSPNYRRRDLFEFSIKINEKAHTHKNTRGNIKDGKLAALSF